MVLFLCVSALYNDDQPFEYFRLLGLLLRVSNVFLRFFMIFCAIHYHVSFNLCTNLILPCSLSRKNKYFLVYRLLKVLRFQVLAVGFLYFKKMIF